MGLFVSEECELGDGWKAKNARRFLCRLRHACAAYPLAIPFCPLIIIIFVYAPDFWSRKRSHIINISIYGVNNYFQKIFKGSKKTLKNQAEIASSSLRNH